MTTHTGSIATAAMTALVAAGAVSLLPRISSGAADPCFASPNAAPPQGSHWYYRLDHGTQRKCWYIGPEGRAVHSAGAQAATAVPLPSARQPSPAPEAAASFPPPARRVAVPQGAAPPSAVPETATPGTQAAAPPSAVTARAPDVSQAAADTPSDGAAASAPAATDQGDGTDAGAPSAAPAQAVSATDAAPDLAGADTPQAATADAGEPAPVTPVRMILLLAGALAVAGLLLRAIVKAGSLWRRRVYVERRAVAWRDEIAREPAPAVPATAMPTRPMPDASAARPPVRAVDERVEPAIDDVEARLRRILLAWERRAA